MCIYITCVYFVARQFTDQTIPKNCDSDGMSFYESFPTLFSILKIICELPFGGTGVLGNRINYI